MKYAVLAALLLFSILSFGQAVDKQALHDSVHTTYMSSIFDNALCSATAIGPHALLTASHCEEPDDTISVDGNDGVTVGMVLRDGNDHSIILLLMDKPFKHYADVTERKLVQGEHVYYWGEPGGHADLYREGYFSGKADFDKWKDDEKHPSLLFDFNEGSGDSGSGIFDAAGRLVSVVSFDSSITSAHMSGAFPLAFTAEQLKAARNY